MARYIGLLRLAGLGWLVVTAIGLGFLAGYWVDSRLHTTPIFLILGIILGVISGFVAFLRLLTQTVRDQDLENARRRPRVRRRHKWEDTPE